MDYCIVREDPDGVGVFIAEQKFEFAILIRLKSRGAAEDGSELHVLGWSERFQHRPLLEELHLDEFHAREDFQRGWESIVAYMVDRSRKLVDDELDPQF